MAPITLGIGTGHAATLGNTPENMRRGGENQMQRPSIAGVDVTELIRNARSDIQEKLSEEGMQRQYEGCLRGVAELDRVIREVPFDVIVVIGDDQHEQFNDDLMPMLAIFDGSELSVAGRFRREAEPGSWRARYPETRTSLPGCPELANHLLYQLALRGFDLARSRRVPPEVGIGHAFVHVYTCYFNDRDIPMVPIMVNALYPPNRPTATRSYMLGQALREAIEEWDSNLRVAIMGSGGLSHPILNEDLDRMVLDAMAQKDTDRLCSIRQEQLIGNTGEILNWIIAAGALEQMEMTVVDYVPYYRSAASTGVGGGFAYWLPA